MMTEIAPKIPNFMDTYNKACRLAAAVFIVADTLNDSEELKTIIKKLSLRLISASVALKDINYSEARATITEIEKNSLELLSMMDIASVSSLISKMNADILRDEFQAFLSGLDEFKEGFGSENHLSVRNVFKDEQIPALQISNSNKEKVFVNSHTSNDYDNGGQRATSLKREESDIGGNGHKRKILRKSLIFEFIKGHNDVSIKDIVPSIPGCSEKTVQRELINLINEGKIKKAGERRWSRYSVV